MIKAQHISLDPYAVTEHLSTPLFAMTGASAGPRLVVTCPDALARGLAERFWELPSLGRMRGSLVLRANTQDPTFDLPDLTMQLPDMNQTHAYYRILGQMADLGMISGRGVPMQRVA